MVQQIRETSIEKFYLGILLLAFFAFNAKAVEAVKSGAKASIAQEQQKELRKELDYLIAPIKTESDLQEYLSSSSMQTSPLKKLSEAGRDRFITSLTFNEKGLSGFNYEDLQQELTASQIYQVLALFGAQDATSLLKDAKAINSLDHMISRTPSTYIFNKNDYPDYACTSRATCTRAIGSICMSGC